MTAKRRDLERDPEIREFARMIVRETIMQTKNMSEVYNALDSDIFAKELAGRTVRIESPSPSPKDTKVTFADTGEEVPGIRRVEVCLDAQSGEMVAALYRWKLNGHEEPSLERATTNNVEISTVTVVSDTHLERQS